MAEVLRINLATQELFDNGREVCQRADDPERRSVGGPRQAPGDRENQCVLDHLERHAALVQLGREPTVRAADGTASTRSRAVGLQ